MGTVTSVGDSGSSICVTQWKFYLWDTEVLSMGHGSSVCGTWKFYLWDAVEVLSVRHGGSSICGTRWKLYVWDMVEVLSARHSDRSVRHHDSSDCMTQRQLCEAQ